MLGLQIKQLVRMQKRVLLKESALTKNKEAEIKREIETELVRKFKQVLFVDFSVSQRIKVFVHAANVTVEEQDELEREMGDAVWHLVRDADKAMNFKVVFN